MDNVTAKNMTQTVKIIEGSYRLKKEGENLPVMLWGNHGVGKTSVVYQFAERNGMECTVLNLASLQPEDILGQVDGKGGYFTPPWFEKSDKPKCIFLDEINRAPKYVLQSVFNLINEGRFHDYQLDMKRDMVIAAANPDDNYEVNTFEDPAFIDRFLHCKVCPSSKEFAKYLKSKNLKNTIVQQTLKKSVSLYQGDKDFEIGFQVGPSNRKLEKMAMMFDILDDSEIEDFGVDLLECSIGFDATAMLLETWRESKKNVWEPKKILAMSQKELEDSFSPDDVDVINVINVKMLEYLKKKLTKKEVAGFIQYFMYIPRDIQVDFGKSIVEVNEQLVDEMDTDYMYGLLNLDS